MFCLIEQIQWTREGVEKTREKKSSDRLNRSDKHQAEKHLGSPTGRRIFIPFCLFQLCQCDWSSDVPALPISPKCSSFFFCFFFHLFSPPPQLICKCVRGESQRGKGAKSNILSRGIRSSFKASRGLHNNDRLIKKRLLVGITRHEQCAAPLLLVLIV